MRFLNCVIAMMLAGMVISAGQEAKPGIKHTMGAHMLGMMIQAFSDDHVLRGTDSIWWGSLQWQIEALRRLEMPPVLMERFGYAPLTSEVKAKIFGLNAARLYGIDPQAKRNPVPADYVDRRKQYKQGGNPTPSNTQYGWVPR